MKKLLIAMTAAAVGFGAWADGEPTLLNENFDSWTNGTDLEYMTELPQGLWTYSGVIGAEELKVVQSESDKALTLNTGSKVLNAKFATSALTIPENTGYIFTSTVNFSDPSDTLPTLADGDKFAIVVLDNVESLTTDGMHNENDKPATNLWVIAGHGVDGTRAYLMQPYAEGDGNLRADFFNRDHTITIKAYNNVMGSGKPANAGFLLKVDDVICTVLKSYAIVNNVINLKNFEGGNYLGYTVNDVALPVRYTTNRQLLISRSQDSTLTSVDFQGQGTIDDVSLATTGSDAIFGPDANTLNFVNYGAEGIVSIKFGETPVENGKYTITEAANSTLTFTVTVANNYVLKTTDADVAKNGNVYTLTYTVTSAASQTITLDVYKPAAYIGETDYKTFALALAAAVSAGSEIKLMDDVPASLFGDIGVITINQGETVEIDLNGFDIATIYNSGTLKIKDSVGTGTVAKNDTLNASVYNDETGKVTIEGGCFEAAITGGTITVSGGKFKVKPADSVLADDDLEFSKDTDTDGYYSVVVKSSDPYEDIKDDSVTGEITNEDAVNATLDAIAGNADDKAKAVADYITAAYGAGGKIPAAVLESAANVDISVYFKLPLMTENAKFVAEPSTTTDGYSAAFEFTLKNGDESALVLTQAVLENVLQMIKVGSDLNSFGNATSADVDTSITGGKLKVQLKTKNGVTKGFMKISAAKPTQP